MKWKLKNQKLRNIIWWISVFFFIGLGGAVRGAMNENYWVEFFVGLVIQLGGMLSVTCLIGRPDEDSKQNDKEVSL